MMLHKRIVVAISLLLLTSSAVKADEIDDDVNWCLNGAADSTLVQQATPFPRTYCKALLAGSIISGLNLEGIQRDWARRGAALSCGSDPNSQAIAVAAIAACQYHDEGRANRALSNRQTVVRALRRFQGCDSFGLPIY